MGKRDEMARRIRTLEKERARLQRRLTKNGIVELRCPRCGSALRVRPGQHSALCFGCGRPADLYAAERDALTRAARDGLDGYTALLSLGEEQLSLSSYVVAAETYTVCCAIDPDCGAAWRGLLLAETENFRKAAEPPADLYERARPLLPDEEAVRLERQWESYTAYVRQKEDLRRAHRRREAERESAREAERQAGQEAETSGRHRALGRALVRTLLLIAGVTIGICFMLSGTGFMLIMGASILSMLGRRRDR